MGKALSGELSCTGTGLVRFGANFVAFILFSMENPVSQQCRPWSDATWCGIWSGPALFAYDLFMGFQVRMGQKINF